MTITVKSPRGAYEVHVGAGVRDALPGLLGSASRVAVIHPGDLQPLAERLAADVDVEVLSIVVPDAEAAKTVEVLQQCWHALAAAGFTRNDVIIGMGGGTATDLAGFVAATWLRGVDFISIPTTVLAMVDAAVGGKTGINLPQGKNLVGSFHEPRGVLCDLDLLSTLPLPEVLSGLAEIIKTGFISDPEVLRLVEQDPRESTDVGSARFAELARRAIQVKADVVADDLTERTSSGARVGREALNYGHTLGHAIEAHHRYTLRHGHAISIGMVWMAEVSRRLLGLDDELVAAHRRLLGGIGLPIHHDADAWPELRRLMSLDKKSRGGTLRLVGLSTQGSPEIIEAPDEAVLEDCFRTIATQAAPGAPGP